MSDEIEEVEAAITGLTLKYGVLLSSGLLLAGLAVDVIHPMEAGPLKPEHVFDLPGAIAHGSAAAMVHLGLLVLMITPLARIIVLAYEFVRQRDYSFALISLGVLLLLVLSFVLGAVE